MQSAISIADVLIRQDAKGRLDIKRVGYVYVLESRCGGFVKVGYSAKPERRLPTLRAAANTEGRQWISTLQPDAARIEGGAHELLSAHRCGKNEWFAIGFDAAVTAVTSLLGTSPSEEEISDARQRANEEGRRNAAALSRQIIGDPPPAEPEAGRDPCELAVEFVLAEERRAVESNFTRTEEDFLRDYDRDVTDFATAELFTPLCLQNVVLIGRGLTYEQRKPILKQYAMDWRMAHGASRVGAEAQSALGAA